MNTDFKDVIRIADENGLRPIVEGLKKINPR